MFIPFSPLAERLHFQEHVRCDIVSFPSEYEGFGMPIIEGQKTGRVVVASRIEPLIEVSGGAVEFVDFQSAESIRRGFLHVIQDDHHRNQIIQKGLNNVIRFEHKKIAEQYLELFSS